MKSREVITKLTITVIHFNFSNAQWNVSESCNAEENKSVGDENFPKIGQPLAAPRSNSFFGRLFRSKDPNRTQFERYAQELRHAIDDEEQSNKFFI